MADSIKWNFPETYRKGYATIGDYILIIEGKGAYQFGWVLQYKNEILLTSNNNNCRSTSEAQRITEALYRFHKISLSKQE
jgi:hypothetical protein